MKPQPILKDLIDPDHRKYGAYSSSEDAYPNGSERSKKVVDDYKQKEDANRRKASAGAAAGKSDTFKGRLGKKSSHNSNNTILLISSITTSAEFS